MKLRDNPHYQKAFKISIVLESFLTIISAYILNAHPEHSYFFLAAIFHYPGSIIGMYVMEFLKIYITSFNILFCISVVISISFQVAIFTGVISIFLKWNDRNK